MKQPLLILASVAVALTGLVGYNLIYVPQQQQVSLIRKQIAQEQASQQTAVTVAGLLQELERRRARLPNEADPSWLVRIVVELAEKTGVQLTTISQETPQPQAEQLTRVAVNLQFDASYHELGAFLDALERSDRFLRVERMHVSRSGSDTPPSIELLLSTFSVSSLVAGSGGASPRP